MRHRLVILAVVGFALIAAAIVVAAIVVARRGIGVSGGTDGRASDAGPATDSPPPPLAAPPAGHRPGPTDAPAPTTASPLSELRVRVVGDGGPIEGATVAVSVVRDVRTRFAPATGVTDASGVTTIDTAGLDRSMSLTVPPMFNVRVDLAGWFSDSVIVSSDRLPTAESIDASISMRRAAIVIGRVLARDGTPIGATAQAVADEDTPPEGTRSLGEGVVASKDGRFRLPVDTEGPALVLVGRGDARPATIPTTLVRGREIDVGDVQLDRGASLAGRVRCRGIPAARTNVIATWYGPGFESARLAGHGLLWVINRRAIWSQLEVHPDNEGRFRLDGLEPGPYRLRVPTEDWGCALHPDAYAEVDRIVRAPDERIDVDADRSLFQIDVVDETTAVGWPWIDVEGQDAITIQGEATGHVSVVLRAGARHRVTVRARGYAASTLDVTAAEAGGRRLETVSLTKARPGEPAASPPYAREGGVLRARVVGPDGVPFAVPFRFFDERGTLLRALARDPREGSLVRSATRTGVGGYFTGFGPSDTKPPRGTVEVGGGFVETKRLDFDAVAEESDDRPPAVIHLHAR